MLKKILKYIPIAAAACYLLFALVIIPRMKDNSSCKDIVIEISGNKLGTINKEEVVEMLKREGLYPKGKNIENVSCLDIEDFIMTMSLVKECQVYRTNDKVVHMKLLCREPVLKVCDKHGAVYYVDNEGCRINDIKKPLLLPVASGEINDRMIGHELKTVATVINKDPFWMKQIEQIYFSANKEAIIIPRMGDHIIELGTVKELDRKLGSIKTFYSEALNKLGWDRYSKLNVKISNKVICTKRER